jgi:hypothetical protein
MDQKIRNIVAIVFVILLALAAGPWLYRTYGGGDGGGEKKMKTSVTLSGFAKGSVGKVTITRSGTDVVLAYRDGKWYVGDDEADETKIDGLFRDFAELKAEAMVAESETSHTKYGVGKDASLRLSIEKDGKDNVFYVGKVGPAAGEFYLRKDGVKNVYLVAGLLRGTIDQDADKWKKETGTKE